MNIATPASAATLAALLLPACTSGTDTDAGARIDNGNALEIAAAAIASSNGLVDSASADRATAAAMLAEAEPALRFDLKSFTLRQLEEIDGGEPLPATITNPGPLGGYVLIDIVDLPPLDEPSTGDSLAFTFFDYVDHAVDGGTITLNGVWRVDLGEVTNNYRIDPTWRFEANNTFENFTASRGSLFATISGSYRAIYVKELLGGSVDLRLDTTFDNNEVTLLAGTGLFYTDDFVTNTYTIDTGGSLRSNSFGVINYSTAETFTGAVLSYGLGRNSVRVPQRPTAGVLLVEGEGSALQVVALSTGRARIEVDSDDDGVFESSFEVSWTDLENH
ncbi:MAG: hypothetical protein KDC98_08785 [Planctomycetes bacterium]|nr:hypothetical protein [Planctomycetota bacterium]